MKLLITLLCVIAALILITFGVNNLSKPSNTDVAIGVGEIVLGLILLFNPLKSLFKKL